MQSRPFSFLFSISYFGARYKGWAPQPNQPTVQRRLERVLRHVLGHEDFSLIGASRTDSGVSCVGGFVQIFLREKVEMDSLLLELNVHLPQDIQLNSVQEVPIDFNLIQSVRQKTYRFYFSNSNDFHPFASAFLLNVAGDLNWEKMKEACELFIGEHNFKGFCRPSENKTDYLRKVISARIASSNELLGQFFPDEIFYFEITGTGFLHHQVRMMMYAIWQIGKGEMELTEIANRFESPGSFEKLPPAPANGLVLWETFLNNL
ncbi:tRNA pseudouridine(38-40) synthase TruA [Algoriphagus halophytocola]|uniref:tRNA pseudouridine synthase A n=1 Tax=Algoriphagus halophytocola TaxID=2991499 RepID=A0ABY6MLR3_9BACT|nr:MULTISPECIES: tRNA pseudouridine(38-40) synthase TruA [unclassified Algoriphagus]UZD24707.1 tRNA pseudouridine(38-40) synthase TruA [Algoriphagus sp. TR-M5]WBL42075.1 tRNA pseudouridine(38-40) synthase TruA [Algoriphagus sp. TR-M9]